MAGRSRRRGWMVAAVAAVVVVALVFAYWFYLSERRRPVEIGNVTVVDGAVTLYVNWCDGDAAVHSLDETDTTVTVVVYSRTRPLGPATECQEDVRLELAAPLGGRVIVDGTTGKTVPVEEIVR